MKKKYTKKDFLSYAEAFYLDEPFFYVVLLKDEIKNLSLKQLQDWFGFTHKEVA
jgi:hypothetical protein